MRNEFELTQQIQKLRRNLRDVALGEAFLLQGGNDICDDL